MDIKMKMKISDRLAIIGMLPQRGNETDMMITSDIREKVDLSAEEIAGSELKTESRDGMSFTNFKNDIETEMEFSQAEVDFLKSQIDKKSKGGELTVSMVKTIRKIRNIGGEK